MNRSDHTEDTMKITRPESATAADDAARFAAEWEKAAEKRKRDAVICESCSDLTVVTTEFKGW